jgi:hypothetical protein
MATPRDGMIGYWSQSLPLYVGAAFATAMAIHRQTAVTRRSTQPLLHPCLHPASRLWRLAILDGKLPDT